jgi:hypothetical protein
VIKCTFGFIGGGGGGSADDTEGSRYKLPGPGDPEGGPTVLHMFLSFSVVPLLVICTN